MQIPKSKHEEFIPQDHRFLFIRRWQIDRDIRSQFTIPCFFCDEAAFQGFIFDPSNLSNESKKFSDRKSRVQRGILRQVSDDLLRLLRILHNIVAANLDGAAGGFEYTYDRLHQGALARTIGTYEPNYLSRLNCEGDIVEGDEATVLLREILNDYVTHACLLPRLLPTFQRDLY